MAEYAVKLQQLTQCGAPSSMLSMHTREGPCGCGGCVSFLQRIWGSARACVERGCGRMGALVWMQARARCTYEQGRAVQCVQALLHEQAA